MAVVAYDKRRSPGRISKRRKPLTALGGSQGYSATKGATQARWRRCSSVNESATDRSAAKRVRYQKLHDGLTLLPNGEYFRARLELALGRSEPPHQALAVLYLSLNLPHAGDELLKMIAGRLAVAVRAEDMLSRLGKDRFACLVPGLLKRDELGDFAINMLNVVSAPLEMGVLHLCVHPSIGIAIHPRNGTSAAALLMNAEFAMYRAKLHDTGYAFADEPKRHTADSG